jgi:putative transposase
VVFEVDKSSVGATAWNKAVAREGVIRELASADQLDRSEVMRACCQLGIKRTRLYELVKAYRERPVTSSLLDKSRQKPSVNRLHMEVRRLCRLRGLNAPCWHALRARIDAVDPAEIARARECSKIARDQFHPVPGQYLVERGFEVVQIDHTLVDVIVVDRYCRQPLQ